MSKFPKVIHVTREGDGEDEYLNVREDGVERIDEPMEVAIYELVEVGRVEITKSYVGRVGYAKPKKKR